MRRQGGKGRVRKPFADLLACAKLGRRFAGGDLGTNKDGRPWADVAAEIVGGLTRRDPETDG